MTYRVPSMQEIAAIDPNGFRVISMFAGAGGSSLGWRMGGFKVLWASEFVEAARETYKLNASPDTVVDGRDVKKVDPFDVMQTLGIGPGDLDVLDGSPPCQAYSTAGSVSKGWGKQKTYSNGESQNNEELFQDYARFVAAFRPKVFVMENVSGLVKGAAKGYFLLILRTLKDIGYRVEARLLDAQWLGVPQARQRLIFVGVRSDLEMAPAFPDPVAGSVNVRDALEGIQAPVDKETDISRCAIWKEAQRLSPGQQSDRFFNLVRADSNAPCPTITATAGSQCPAGVIHHSGTRKFSIAELKRLSSFPDDFEMIGTFAQKGTCLGNAVPPFLMRAVAETVRDGILCKVKR